MVETVCCDTKEELHARERYYIENTYCVNLMIPGRTKKEYYEKNKEKLKQQIKEYQEDKKEIYAQYNKKYTKENRETILKKKKKYHEENKKEISDKRKVKITCECGSVVRKAEISRHKKSKKHQDFISQSK